MKKNYNYIFLLMLFSLIFIPVKVFALPETIDVSGYGSTNADLKVFSKGWISVETGSTSSAYKTEKECKKLNGTYNKNEPRNKYNQNSISCTPSTPAGLDYCEPKYLTAYACSSLYGTTTRCYKDGMVRGSQTFTAANTTRKVLKQDVNIRFAKSLSSLPNQGLGWGRDDKNTYYLCSWASTQSVIQSKETKISEAIYQVTGADSPAYCVHPGKPFKSGTYVLKKEFNLNECKNSSSGYCGFAAIIQEGEKNYNGNYTIINTALRLYASRHLSDMNDDWWDHVSNSTFKRANFYKLTADYVLSNGYSGSSTSPKDNIMYGGNELSQAIELFKKAESGSIEFNGVEVKLFSPTDPINVSNVAQEIMLSTNFEIGKTTIKSVSATENVQVLSYELIPCNDKTCLKVLVNTANVGDAKSFKINLEYDHPGDVLSRIGYYEPNGGSKYQGMFIYDKNSISSIEIEIKINDFTCNYDPETGQYYGRDGLPVSYEEYLEVCECVWVDGTPYLKYPDEPTTPERFHEECEKFTCKREPIDYDDMIDDCNEKGGVGNMKDPEICRILNRENVNNLDNNYITDYGNSYCKIYNRETLQFTFMDKETALAGQHFTHSVTSKYLKENYLSTVILSNRQAASVIDYERWKRDYDAANSRVLETWNILKSWEALYNHISEYHSEKYTNNCGHSTGCCKGGCSGTCNGKPCSKCCDSGCSISCPKDYYVWYWGTMGSGPFPYRVTSSDGSTTIGRPTHQSGGSTCSANCCSGTCNVTVSYPTDAGIRSGYNSAMNNYKGALDERERLLYALMDCNMMNNKNKIYTKPSYYTSSHGGSYTPSIDLQMYDRFLKDFPDPNVDITYEEQDYSYEYDLSEANLVKIEKSVSEPVETTRTFSKEKEWADYCDSGVESEAACQNDLRGLTSNSNNEPLDYWLCTGSETGAICRNQKITFPINTIVNIEVEKEFGYYQDEDFYTQVYTGILRNSPSSLGYWMELEDHIWPVGMLRLTGDYDINVSYDDLNATNRKIEFESGDLLCSYGVINDLSKFDCDDGYHDCYDCVGSDDCDDDKLNLGVYFRTIDLNDVFPNSQYSPSTTGISNSLHRRNIGKNWINEKEVIEEIQELGDKVYTTKPIQYKVTLTPSTIKSIQKSNKLKEGEGGYLDYSLINCGSSLHCESNFLKNELKEILGNKYEDLYKTNTRIGLYDYRR